MGYATADVPAARAGLIAEALMRLNQQLTLGNFEMDYDAGRVFFRITNVFLSEAGDASIIASLVHAAVAEIDRLSLERKAPATMAIWRDALEAIEGPRQARLL